MGRGFSHKAGCSLARPSGGVRRGKRGRMSRSAVGNGFGFDLRRLKGLGVEELVTLRSKIDAMVKTKAPLLKEKIKTLQATLAAIR